MSPSRLFIRCPVATTLLIAAVMLIGNFAYQFLSIPAAFAVPQVNYSTIQTFYLGASPDVMTSSATASLEVQFGEMPELNQLNHMPSRSSAGASVITLKFSFDLSLDSAEQPVRAAINAAGNSRPADLPGAADLRRGSSRRSADPDFVADLEDDAPDRQPGDRGGRQPEVSKANFGAGAGHANGAHDQPKPAFLGGKPHIQLYPAGLAQPANRPRVTGKAPQNRSADEQHPLTTVAISPQE
jgi:hypothetical protein